MTSATLPGALRHVLCAVDLDLDTDTVFAHALRIALGVRGELTVVHAVTDDTPPHWSALPTVRELLVRWKVLAADSTLEAYHDLGLRVTVRPVRGNTTVGALLTETTRADVDLLVLGSHHHSTLDHLVQPSVAEPVARKSGHHALFVRPEGHPLVGLEDGRVDVRRVLVPVTENAPAEPAIEGAMRLCAAIGVSRAHGTLVYVGRRDSMPEIDMQPYAAWAWDSEIRDGPVLEGILDVAAEAAPQLLAMSAHGHDGLLDRIRGSLTERVLHQAHCAVLTVPVQ